MSGPESGAESGTTNGRERSARDGGELAIAHRRVRLGEVELHVAELGPPTGRLLLLLHGFPEYWRAWRHQIGYFARRGFRVVAPDQRGYNLSSKPAAVSAYGLDRLADDIVGLIDEAGRERAVVVGHDWGGVAAWWTALRNPDRVERLAVASAPHPRVLRRAILSDPDQRRRTWYVFFFQLPWLPEYWYRRRDFAIGVRSVRGSARRGTFSDADMVRYREAWSQPGALRSMIHWYRAALRCPPRRLASERVTVPTLLLWGERDRFLSPALVEPTLALCDRAEVARFPEARHWLPQEEPMGFNERLLDFLAS